MSIDAYAAGLIDGEGCIYVAPSKPNRKGLRSASVMIEVGMTKKAIHVLRMLKTHYGGKIYSMRAATNKWEEAFTWGVYGAEAEPVLRRLLPHLILKTEQALLALRVLDLRRSLIPPGRMLAKWTPEASAKAMKMVEESHRLNRKGPIPDSLPPIPGAILTAQRVGGEWMKVASSPNTPLEKWSGSWPSAGTGSATEFWTWPDSGFPSAGVELSLSDILETGPVPTKYYLSPRAAAGILKRADARHRSLPPLLRQALERVALTTTKPKPDTSSVPSSPARPDVGVLRELPEAS